MKVLILSAGDDTGGVGAALQRALTKHTDVEARAVHRSQNYIDYPYDILWPKGEPVTDELHALFDGADVVHVMEHWQAAAPFAGWEAKRLVIHHHGAQFRANWRGLVQTTQDYGAVPIVSTPELALLDPSAEWLPNPCDIKNLSAMSTFDRRGPIGHSPTSHSWKGTDAFIKATEGMATDIIEHVPWAECLRRKARCSVLFDQFYIGYALAGIEAMAMGLPVVAGASDPRLLELGIPKGRHLVEYLAAMWGYLPFLVADETTLGQRLIELATDDALYAQTAALGWYHVNRFHDEAKVARQLVGIYERTLG